MATSKTTRSTRTGKASPEPASNAAALANTKPSAYALLSRIIDGGSAAEGEFIYGLLENCSGATDVREAAFEMSCIALGLPGVLESRDRNDLDNFMRFIVEDDGWLQDFLMSIVRRRLSGERLTPGDVMESLSGDILRFDVDVAAARHIIMNFPSEVAVEVAAMEVKRSAPVCQVCGEAASGSGLCWRCAELARRLSCLSPKTAAALLDSATAKEAK